MIAISVFSIMMLSAFEVYSQVMFLSQRLELQREIQQSARIVSEHMAEELRTKNFDLDHTKKLDNQTKLTFGTGVDSMGASFKIGYRWTKKSDGSECDASIASGEQCQIEYTNLHDKKEILTSDRVTVSSLSFEIMGESAGAGGAGAGINVDLSTTPKVRVLMTLEPKSGVGVSSALISQTRLYLDTILSTRIYQSQN